MPLGALGGLGCPWRVPRGLKVGLLMDFGCPLGGLGAHSLEKISLLTMIFRYMFFVWFPASFFEDFGVPGDPQNLRNH